MSDGGQPQTSFDSLFEGLKLQLVIPSSPNDHAVPAANGESSKEGSRSKEQARSVAFLDENLAYSVIATIPEAGSSSSSTQTPSKHLQNFLSCLQLSMNLSFIPPLPPTSSKSLQEQQRTSLPPNTASTSTSLAPPTGQKDSGDQESHDGYTSSPYTPNPFPSTEKGEERYAFSEGVTVWEGPVELRDKKGPGRDVRRTEEGWEVSWPGEVTISYVRTQFQNPMLCLTLSATLREQSLGHSIVHGMSESHDGHEEDENEEDLLAGMEDIDLLGGLIPGGNSLPSRRLAASLRQDLSLPDTYSNGSIPPTATTADTIATPLPQPESNAVTPSTSGAKRQRGLSITVKTPSKITSTTMRKSYRRVLALSSGLRVRMRTLFLPQLLPPPNSSLSNGDHQDEGEGEKRVGLCVEIENPMDTATNHNYAFEIENVVINVGGKGVKATAELLCQPEQLVESDEAESSGSGKVFPMNLKSAEQYNMLYVVNLCSGPDGQYGQYVEDPASQGFGKGDEHRPVAIVVTGRPYIDSSDVASADDKEEISYITKPFESRWNCTLDLGPFYASIRSSNIPPPPIPQSTRGRSSKPIAQQPNAIVGDKRYSLSVLMSNSPSSSSASGSRPNTMTTLPNKAQMQHLQQPRLPSSASIPLSQNRSASMALPVREQERQGLMLSVKVLSKEGGKQSIKPLEPFSVEVFIHNRSEDVRRFRLSIPERDSLSGQVREAWERRRRRGDEEVPWGIDDPALRPLFAQYLADSPALIPLENDIRCGPLYPGASMAARIRFLPLYEGVHRIQKLRIIGFNEEMDFIMSPVLDVVVGEGVEAI